MRDHRDSEHRRERDHARDRQGVRAGGIEAERGAHRMREDEIGRGQLRLHLGHRQREIGLVVLEAPDMALARAADEALRAALAAPVEGQHMEAAAAQLRDGLAVALDELGPALYYDDRAAHRFHGRAPAREAQGSAVARHREPGLAVPGDGIIRIGEKGGLGHQVLRIATAPSDRGCNKLDILHRISCENMSVRQQRNSRADFVSEKMGS